MALSDEYLCIYVVDPETEEYFEYDASSDYANLEIAGKGTGFFARALEESERVIHHDDLPTLADQFTKENVLSTIRADGNFTLRYRLMMQSGPVPVRLKAALVEEQEGPRLILGVTRA